MTSRAGTTILERILDGREPLLDLMSEYRAAIEQEVRDDIRARVEALRKPPAHGSGRWALGWNEALDEVVLAISRHESATQDGERPGLLHPDDAYLDAGDPFVSGEISLDDGRAPTPDDRDREEFAQAAEPIVRWYMEHVADPEVVAKWAGLRASGGTE